MQNTAMLSIEDFGLSDYETIWALQKERIQQRFVHQVSDTLMLGEHLPVITLGRGSHLENLLVKQQDMTIPIVAIERGGDVTYHGPGQLIAYPLLLLPPERRDLHRYLRDLEEVLILTLQAFNLQGCRNPGWTGVWVQHKGELLKLASIGVAVKQWVTYHGIALNVSTDLSAFSLINPCGLESQKMTSLSTVLGEAITVECVKPVLIKAFFEVFGLTTLTRASV